MTSAQRQPDDPFRSPRFHYTFGPHAPVLTVDAGTRLRIACPDSDNAWPDGTTLTAGERQSAEGTALFEGNPLAGPIHVRGAAPGDALAVTIHDVELDRDFGQTWMAPGHGLLPRRMLLPRCDGADPDPMPRHMFRWRIDVAMGQATIENPMGDRDITVPLAPFVGCVGLCPAWGQSVGTLFSGPFGGNLDVDVLGPGTTVWLPVHHDGGLLFVGDIHAAQGEGEIMGGAIETSGIVDLTAKVAKETAVEFIRFRSADAIGTIAVAGDLHTAVQEAYATLIRWLSEVGGLNRWDAYALVTQAAGVKLGNIVSGTHVVASTLGVEKMPDGVAGRLT